MKQKTNGEFNIIYADPPWRFKNWSMNELATRGEKWARRNGRSPYDVMTLADICTMPVADLAAKDCILFCWTTYPKLQEGLDVVKAWGFEFKTVAFTWVKTTKRNRGWHYGLGYWTRQNPEICLLATKGKPKRIDKCVQNLVVSPLRGHSQKPDEVADRIVELVGDLPRVELFARQPRQGWHVWGNEVEPTISFNGIKKTSIADMSDIQHKYHLEYLHEEAIRQMSMEL